LFEGLKDHFPVINGFIWLNNNEPVFRKKDWKKNLSKISIAYHTGCEVTSGYAFTEIDKSEKISVDQSFVAGIVINNQMS
jgi:hypothetical protein